MEMQPKVSVILPVYNVEKYLHQCLDSIQQQTLTDIEIICVDDGSTDGSPAILDEYAQQDARFIILHQENKGAGAARNSGLEVARGEYLLFLDADDFFEHKMLELSYKKACQLNADIVIFKADRYLQTEDKFVDISSINYKLLPQCDCFAATDVEKNIFRSVVGWTWDKLFRHNFVKRFNIRFQEIRIHNDLLFTYAALISAERITLLNHKFTHQRKRGGGSISDEFREWWCTFDALKGLKQYIESHNFSNRFGQDFTNYAAYLLLYNLNRLQGDTAQQFQNYMRQSWMRELGIEDMPEDNFYDHSAWEQCRRISFSVAPMPQHVEISDTPKVSVIVPSLNSAKYIDECIVSILSQTLTDIEVLCVDAGSTDGTIEKLNTFAQQDARIHVIHSDKKSYGYQINLGLDAARGKFFGIVESDDYILSNMYETLYGLAQQFQLDSIKSDFCIFYGDEKTRTFTTRFLTDDSKKYNRVLNPSEDITLFKANNINPPGIYSLDFIRNCNIRLNETSGASYQDNGLWFQIFAQSKRMYFYPCPFYMVRRDNPDSSVKSTKKIYCSCREYDFIRGILKKDSKLEEKYAPLCALYRYNNYNFTLNRIAPEYQLGFLEKYSEDFREIEFNGELKQNLFTISQWKVLRQIMDDPDGFYRNRIANKGSSVVVDSVLCTPKHGNSNPQIHDLTRRLNEANQEIRDIRSSWTYRIGRFMTWIPRKIRGCIRCYKENGLYYTWNRILIHLHLKCDVQHISKKMPVQVVTQPLQKVPASPPIKKDYEFFKNLSPSQYAEELKLWYERVTTEPLDLEHPKTFNEKIQWLKLYDTTPLKTLLADKYLVREWVKEKIGEKYLVPLLGVWEHFDEINFDCLPDQFVLKTNHGSGWNLIVRCKSDMDLKSSAEKFDQWLKRNYAFVYGLELQYMNVPPKILAETYIADLDGEILDYRFFCFNGKPVYVWVDIGSGTTHHKRNIYDINWNLQSYKVNYPLIEPAPEKPTTFDEMVECASKLSKDFAFVRIDFYSVNGRVYFGEMTFTPQSGTGKWEDPEQNSIYGDLIKLPPKSPLPERKF